MNIPQSLRYLGVLALIEGASVVALVGVAMPLKYYAVLPEALRVVGMAHGALFCWRPQPWSGRWVAVISRPPRAPALSSRR